MASGEIDRIVEPRRSEIVQIPYVKGSCCSCILFISFYKKLIGNTLRVNELMLLHTTW